MKLGKYTPDDASLINDHLQHYIAAARKKLEHMQTIKDSYLREMTEKEREYYRHAIGAFRWAMIRKQQIMECPKNGSVTFGGHSGQLDKERSGRLHGEAVPQREEQERSYRITSKADGR